MKLTNNLYFYPEEGMMDCNTYLIKDDISIIIDPGSTQFLPNKVANLFKDGIDTKDINIITNTHLHGDHYWANEGLKNLSGAKILSHPVQKKFQDTTVVDSARFFGFKPIEFNQDGDLDNKKLTTENMEFELIPSPGHSLDSVCFYCQKEKILICGDVIFAQNTGRVDLPGGSADQLKKSIEKLSELDIEYLLPGHMNIIIGAEKVRSNFEFIRKHVFSWL